MLFLLSLLGILLGSAAMIVGLVLIAPQVRVHQIEKKSRGSQTFLIGSGLVSVGLLFLLLDSGTMVMAQVGLLMGFLGFLVAGLVGHHEYLQTQEADSREWDWRQSLMAQMLASSGAILVLAAVGLVIL
ncbi:MAG: hypothetical protein L0154_26015 [Chloroflexi bacterium]|nr:hypothetical protein [Chloroflexota bacterium]